MKGSVEVEAFAPREMALYAQICGWTLARAHARSGDPVAIAAYMGTDDVFDRAVGKFAKKYADQTERDYEAFLAAIHSGRLQATEGV
jgi:hypothetical protein